MPRSAVGVALATLVALLLLAAPATASRQTECNPFGKRACLMPFPNDMNLTVRDTSTPTGLRVRLPRGGIVRNRDGEYADPAEWNRLDGFSPGQTIVVRVPGLDTPRAVRRSKLTRITKSASRASRGSRSTGRRWSTGTRDRTSTA